jgi:hypothetical protein
MDDLPHASDWGPEHQEHSNGDAEDVDEPRSQKPPKNHSRLSKKGNAMPTNMVASFLQG